MASGIVMTPDEIRQARRDLGRMTDDQLRRMQEGGAANLGSETWRMVMEEIDRRERSRGVDYDEPPTSFLPVGWLIIGTCIGLLGCTALALIPWLQSNRREPPYGFLVLFPLMALFALGLAVGILAAAIMLGKDSTTRTRLNLTVACAGALALVTALGAMLFFW
jgi:hypothetical protein